jgi:hypothetical protein
MVLCGLLRVMSRKRPPCRSPERDPGSSQYASSAPARLASPLRLRAVSPADEGHSCRTLYVDRHQDDASDEFDERRVMIPMRIRMLIVARITGGCAPAR